MEQIALNWDAPRRQYSVSELTDELNDVFRGAYAEIWVAGEVSGLKASAAGHIYFTLKDGGAQLSCACFKMSLLRMRIKPADGLAIVARGRLEIYPQRGQYQLIVDQIELQGFGARQLAFEQLKKRLAAEGLFDPDRKRSLPPYPRRIGIVTSPAGAVIQDMLNILERRAPSIHVRLYPALVQGDGAAAQIRRAIDHFSREPWADLIIVGRGGGSLEDLWAFNEEVVARAIAGCAIPVVSAVGHETDFTIADFAADLRAPTPSAAAEIVTAHWVALPGKLAGEMRHLQRAIELRLARSRDRLGRQGIDRAQAMMTLRLNRLEQRLDDNSFRLREALRRDTEARSRRLIAIENRVRAHDPRVRLLFSRTRLEALRQRLADSIRKRILSPVPALGRLDERLRAAVRFHVSRSRPRVEALTASLASLSPLRVLDRGYAIVQDAGGTALKSPPASGTKLSIRYAEGRGTAVSAGAAAPTPGDSSELPS